MKSKAAFTGSAIVLAAWFSSFSASAALTLPPLLGLPTGLPGVISNAGLKVGCPWGTGNDTESNNTGIVDAAATYRYSTIPVNPGGGAKIRLTGRFPKARYFSFQTYDGFRPGNDIDQSSDAIILSSQGGALNPNPAFLANRNGYTDTYSVDILFEDRPAPPLVRAPNTLYAGSGTTHLAFNKQLVYRIYLPNPGADKLGDQPLPTQTFIGPQGTFDLQATPDKQQCKTAALLEKYNIIFPTAGLGMSQSKIHFRVVSGRGGLNFYPNGDGNFLGGLVGKQYGDLVVVRGRAASYPPLPPLVNLNPDTRYYSLCMYQSLNSAATGCVADRDTVLQPDGTFNFVISAPAKRPVMATSAFGYNWLPFGNDLNGTIGIRQILPNPNFEGNLNRALANPEAPLEETLGSYAPKITYCDSATFAAYAGSGGDAVFNACKTAADQRAFLGTFVGTLLP